MSRASKHIPNGNRSADLQEFGTDLRTRCHEQRVQQTLPFRLVLPRTVWIIHE
jgi:hypothetical protein